MIYNLSFAVNLTRSVTKDYTYNIPGREEDRGNTVDIFLNLTTNGIVIKEGINCFEKTISLFIPKKNPIRHKDAFDDGTGAYSKAFYYQFIRDYNDKIIKIGDRINFNFGYENGRNDTNYINYSGVEKIKESYRGSGGEIGRIGDMDYIVTEIITSDNEVEVKCEDIMYFFKRAEFIANGKEMSVKEIAEKMLEYVNKEIDEYNIIYQNVKNYKTAFRTGVPNIYSLEVKVDVGKIKFTGKNISCFEVLKQLYKIYGLQSKISTEQNSVDEEFYCILNIGDNWDFKPSDEVKEISFTDIPYELIENIDKEYAKKFKKIISKENLKYRTSDNIKLKLIGKIYKRTGKPTEISAKNNDIEGEVRTFTYHNESGNQSEAYFQKKLDLEFEKLKISGFSKNSSFTTFGYPVVKPGDISIFDGMGILKPNETINFNVKNGYILEREAYIITGVKTTFNSEGWRQEVEIGYKIPNTDLKNKDKSLVDRLKEVYQFQTTQEFIEEFSKNSWVWDYYFDKKDKKWKQF